MTATPLILDVSPAEPVRNDMVIGSLHRALRWGGSHKVHERWDSVGTPVGDADLLDAWSCHTDGMLLREIERDRMRLHPSVVQEARRCDALPAGVPGFPRDFEFVRSRVFEEARVPLSGMRLFPSDTSVPLGAKKHTARRALGAGEAQIHGGGSEFPRARTTYAEESFNVAYVVCAVDQNFFEALTTDWAGLQQYQRDLRLAQRLVEERLNRIIWNGAPEAGLYGVLNYPHLAKMVIPTAFTDASMPEDVAVALTDVINTPMISSSGIFNPTALAVSPRIGAFISSRKHSSTGGTDLTIAKYFLSTQQDGGAGISRIDVVPELAGVGPNGEDAIFAYRPDLDSIGHVLIQPPTPLPVFQSSPIDQITVVFAATGGMVMPDIGNAILAFVDVTA